MSGRGRGLDMTRPAWMTEGLNGSAPGAPQTNGNSSSMPAPGSTHPSGQPQSQQAQAQQPQQQQGGWRGPPPGASQVPRPVSTMMQRPVPTSLQEQRPLIPQMPGRPPVGLPPGIGGRPSGMPIPQGSMPMAQGAPRPTMNIRGVNISPASNMAHLTHQMQQPPRLQPLGGMRPQPIMPVPGGQVPLGQYPLHMGPAPASGAAMGAMAGQRPSMSSVSGNQPAGQQQREPTSQWTEHCAPNGRKYYFNVRTQESKWEKPAELASTESSSADSEWKEYQSADGKKYYYNRLTRESKWYLPDTKSKSSASGHAQGVSGAKPAVQFVNMVWIEHMSGGGDQVVKLDTVASGAGQAQENGISKTLIAQGMASNLLAPPAVAKSSPQGATSLDEKKAIFKELLASIGCGPDWTWEQTMRLAAQDKDKRYGVLKTLADRKACFYEFQEEKKLMQREGRLQAEKSAREDFIQMVEECGEIGHSTRFSKVKELLGEDPRWRAVDERLRETYFIKHMRDCQDKENKEKRAERKAKMSAFRDLLKQNNVKVTSTWRKVSSRLEGHDEFEALDRSERLDVFQDYIRELEVHEQESKKQAEQEIRRKLKKNRDAFKDLLKRHREQGIINAKTRWKEYGTYVQYDEAYIAVSKNKSGSRPRELFEDILEEMEEVYNKDRALMKEVYKKSDIIVSVSTSFDSFMEAMQEEDSRMTTCQKSNVRLIYDELHAKAREKEAKETKRKKKVRDDFLSELKRCRAIKDGTTWEEGQQLLENVEIKAEEASDLHEVFDEYMVKLKKKEEKRKKKESSPESSLDDQKHRSHKRHKRRHSDSGDDIVHKRHHRKRHHSDSDDEDRKRSKRSKKDKDKGKERDKGRDRDRDRKHREHKDRDRDADKRMRKVRSPAVVEPDHSNPGDPPPRSDKSPSEQENAPINAAPTHGVDVVLDSDDQLSDGDAARQANREDGEAGQRGPHKMDAVEVKEASDAEEGEVAA